eukprot:TRINITY_DN5332_c0_g1::TRINITY_DN5332_c0_g1_i1::g.24123::m.24123 TRINITY_DN5332_c0_g1::TRINITY_DN5332_c0_g1_i1::g.24123  ORF type:complete len:286 (-),score=37.71,sp/P87148/YIF1_SCHPO/35.39/6e-38,YIF1/PF03878.10/8.6e-62,Yip1/PF04893.12/0.13 TRINITY_DN5332_c0_g1_i1:82-939(-)
MYAQQGMYPQQQHQPQYPNTQPQGFPSGMQPQFVGMDSPFTQIGMQYGQQFLSTQTEQLQSNFNRYVDLAHLRQYFAVSNSYVLNKLKVILCPALHKSWARQRPDGVMDGIGGGPESSSHTYMAPCDDINAPDLYIPAMAFITYVLALGFAYGHGDQFHPDVLGSTLSAGLGAVVFEVLLTSLTFYVMNSRAVPWLDLTSYSMYKFVGVVLTVLSYLVLGSLSYVVFLYTAAMSALFILRTYMRIIVPEHVHVEDMHNPTRNYALLFLAAFQFPMAWYLGMTIRL